MKMVNLSLTVCACLIAIPCVAQPAFEITLRGSTNLTTDCVSGNPGRGEYTVMLRTLGDHQGTGAHAWSLAFRAEGAIRITSVGVEGTDAADRGDDPPGLRADGFVHNELTEGQGNKGAISAVVLSLSLQDGALVTLPVNRSASLCVLQVESESPPCETSAGSITLGNDLLGSGLPVDTKISWNGDSFIPSYDPLPIRVGPPVEDSGFQRGDANRDASIDLSDGIFILSFLFLGREAPYCRKSADTDDSGSIDLTDSISVFNYLFLGGVTPPSPGPLECGLDPTADELECPDDTCISV